MSDNVRIIKGQPDDVQREALERVVDELAQQAEHLRNRKPHPRGWYGTPQARVAGYEPNPRGFRTPRVPFHDE